METSSLLSGCLLGMVLGLFGQGLRATAGLKKQADEAGVRNIPLREVFDATSFWFSLFTGAMAGMAAYLGLKYGASPGATGPDLNSGSAVLGIIAAGYAGADFIESFAKKYLPAQSLQPSVHQSARIVADLPPQTSNVPVSRIPTQTDLPEPMTASAT